MCYQRYCCCCCCCCCFCNHQYQYQRTTISNCYARLLNRFTHAPDLKYLFVGCLTSQQHVSVSQGRICTDKFTCYHTEIEVADQTFYLTQSQYTDTGPTSPSANPIMQGSWQGSQWSANFEATGVTRTPDLPLPRRAP